MRSLPHIAIGCATVWAGCRLLGGLSSPSPSDREPVADDRNGSPPDVATPPMADAVDFRLVAAGSLLPDIVDRLLKGRLGVQTRSPHQHLLGHTVAFNATVVLAGLSLMKSRQDPRLLGMAAAAITHLLVDPVIRSPRTLFWPLLGLEFPEARGLNRPLTAITQVLAALAITAAAFQLARKGRLPEFVSNGRL
jgi:hypothetical protein